MALACSWVYSWHAGGAVLVTKPNRDVQSVTAIEESSLKVAVLDWNYESHPHRPSSTCTPRMHDGLVAPSFYNKYEQGSKGEGMKPRDLKVRSNSVNQRNGASISPYADFSNLHTSYDLSFMADTISGVGSIAITRSSWVLPCKKAASMSNDMSDQCMDAITCAMSIFDVLPNVGLSRGIVSSWGSIHPSTTNRALAFRDFPPFSFCSLGHSMGFHTHSHLHLKICLGDSSFRNMRMTVPVCNQLLTSLDLAASNSRLSSGSKLLNLTSVLCFLVAVASIRNCSSEGLWEVLQNSVSCCLVNSRPAFQTKFWSSGPMTSMAWSSIHVRRSHISSSAASSGTGISCGCLTSGQLISGYFGIILWAVITGVGMLIGLWVTTGSWSGCSNEIWLEVRLWDSAGPLGLAMLFSCDCGSSGIVIFAWLAGLLDVTLLGLCVISSGFFSSGIN